MLTEVFQSETLRGHHQAAPCLYILSPVTPTIGQHCACPPLPLSRPPTSPLPLPFASSPLKQTVFTSYVAVIAGLVTTLMLLALARKALPALPVSIALGVLFYFLTRLVMEPVVVPVILSLNFF